MGVIESLQILLLTRDQELEPRLRRLLQREATELEVYCDPGAALERLRRWRYDALIVDCDRVSGAQDLVQTLRSLPPTREAVIFAVVGESSEASTAFRLGATFVLDRQQTDELMQQTLRAGQGAILRSRQRYFRAPVELVVEVNVGPRQELVRSMNLSEGGMAVRLSRQAEPGGRLRVRFSLPQEGEVRAETQVIWSDHEGRAGLRFLDVAGSGAERLRRWLMGQLLRRLAPAHVTTLRKLRVTSPEKPRGPAVQRVPKKRSER